MRLDPDVFVTMLARTVSERFSYSSWFEPGCREGEAEFVDNYDPSKYGLTVDSVVLTADACVFAVSEDELKVLMIERGNHPFKGRWCLPGGFVDSGEDAHVAAVRELVEETGVEAEPSAFVGVYAHPGRDPRMRNMVSYCYMFVVDSELEVEGLDDASDAKWVSLTSVLDGTVSVGFDHQLMVAQAVPMLLEVLKGK